MVMNDFEKKLARLSLCKPSDDLDERVFAQKPSMELTPIKMRWWQRRIAIPLPLAACLALAFFMLLFWRVRPEAIKASIIRPFSKGRIASAPAPAPPPQPQYYEVAVYVPGAGKIYTEKNYTQE
jgi:hypothetical protein